MSTDDKPDREIIGDVVSITFTLKVVGIAVLPVVSVALHVTRVDPNANKVPDVGEHVAVPGGSMLSLVAGVVYDTVAPAGLVASTVSFKCAAITGNSASETIMSKVVGMAELNAVSIALQVTVVEPIGNRVSDDGEQVAIPGASTLSLVSGDVYDTVTPAALVASANTSA